MELLKLYIHITGEMENTLETNMCLQYNISKNCNLY